MSFNEVGKIIFKGNNKLIKFCYKKLHRFVFQVAELIADGGFNSEYTKIGGWAENKVYFCATLELEREMFLSCSWDIKL